MKWGSGRGFAGYPIQGSPANRNVPRSKDAQSCAKLSEFGLGALEELHRSFMLFRSLPTGKCPEIAASASLRVFLAGVQAVLSTFQFPYHAASRFCLARAALIAELCRDFAGRFFAAERACFASELGDAPECPSFLRAVLVARDRLGEGFCLEWLCPRS